MNYILNLPFDPNLTDHEHIDISPNSVWFDKFLPQQLYGVREILNPNLAINGFFSGWGCLGKDYGNLNLHTRMITPVYDEKIDNKNDSYFSSGYVKYVSYSIKDELNKVLKGIRSDGKEVKPILSTFRLNSITLKFNSSLGSFYNVYNIINYPPDMSIDFVLYDNDLNEFIRSDSKCKSDYKSNTSDLKCLGIDGLNNYSYELTFTPTLSYEKFINLENFILFIKPTDNFSDLPVFIPIGNVELQLNFDCGFQDGVNPDNPNRHVAKWSFRNFLFNDEMKENDFKIDGVQYKVYASVSNIGSIASINLLDELCAFNIDDNYYYEITFDDKDEHGELTFNDLIPGKYCINNILLRNEETKEINTDVLFEVFDNGVITISNGDDICYGACYYNFISSNVDDNINKVYLNTNSYFKCNKDTDLQAFQEFYYDKDTKQIILNTPVDQTFLNNTGEIMDKINVLRC